MPIYEYQCESCGHEFERQQKMRDAPVSKCPECGKAVRRVIGAVAGFVRGSSLPCNDKAPCCGAETRCDKRSCEMLDR